MKLSYYYILDVNIRKPNLHSHKVDDKEAIVGSAIFSQTIGKGIMAA